MSRNKQIATRLRDNTTFYLTRSGYSRTDMVCSTPRSCTSLQEGDIIEHLPLHPVAFSSYAIAETRPDDLTTFQDTSSWSKTSERFLMHLGLASAVTTLACSSKASAESEEGLSKVPGRQGKDLSFSFGNSMTPHPEKLSKGGEDAYFVHLGDVIGFGVADGVGGWASLGIDPSKYSKSLMKFCQQELRDRPDTVDPVEILQRAFDRVTQDQYQGSSTALVCTIVNDCLRLAYIGDSGLVVIRRSASGRPELAFRSEDQLHGFNFPFQLGNGSSDYPCNSITAEVQLMSGDVIVAATDGVFDNLFDFEILQMVEDHPDASSQELSSLIATRAVEASHNQTLLTPFGKKAEESMRFWMGGKEDDITVVVLKVD